LAHFPNSGRFFKVLEISGRPEQGAGELGPLAGKKPYYLYGAKYFLEANIL